MPKTLTKLPEQIVGTTLSISATEYVWLSCGQINSLNRLKELEMVDQRCYGQVQPRHLKPELITTFFSENGEVFAIESLRAICWLVFDNRKIIARAKDEDDAKRVVAAMKLLRQHEKKQCRKDSTSPQMDRRSVVNAALTGPPAMSAALAWFSCSRVSNRDGSFSRRCRTVFRYA